MGSCLECLPHREVPFNTGAGDCPQWPPGSLSLSFPACNKETVTPAQQVAVRIIGNTHLNFLAPCGPPVRRSPCKVDGADPWASRAGELWALLGASAFLYCPVHPWSHFTWQLDASSWGACSLPVSLLGSPLAEPSGPDWTWALVVVRASGR